jgi:hypothetical protein
VCRSAPQDAKDYFQAIESKNAAKAAKKKQHVHLKQLPTQGSGSGSYAPGAVGSSSGQMGIKQAFSNCSKADADAAVCRFFYAEGIPFLKVDSPYFLEALKAVSAFGPGYRPPPMKRLRTDCLDKEYDMVERELEVGF